MYHESPRPPYSTMPRPTRSRGYSESGYSAYYGEDAEPRLHRRRTDDPPRTARDEYHEPRMHRRRTDGPSWTANNEYSEPRMHRRRTDGPYRTTDDEDSEVIRPTSISEPESEPDDTPEKPTLLLPPPPITNQKPASEHGSEGSKGSKGSKGSDPYSDARRKGKADIEALRTTITIVLLHEWCMADGEVYTHPDSFKMAFKLLPVVRDRHGVLEPIADPTGKWGVKTHYDPQYGSYLPTILITVPRMLSHVSPKMVKAAYQRLAAGPRTERLVDLYDIPFKDHTDYRNYAMLFKFESGRELPLLFDDYLLEDAVVRIPPGESGKRKVKSKDKHKSRHRSKDRSKDRKSKR